MTTADYRPTRSTRVYVVFHSEGLTTRKYVFVTFYRGRKPFPDDDHVKPVYIGTHTCNTQ